MIQQTELFGGLSQNVLEDGAIENEFLPTPKGLTRALVPLLPLRPDSEEQILEPCCGAYAISEELKCQYPMADVISTDIIYNLADDATTPIYWQTFHKTDWVITNPPFSAAPEILPLAFSTARIGVAFLLRLTYAEPAVNRALWLQEYSDHLRYLQVFNPRPQFRRDKSGGDSCTVAWFVFLKSWSWEAMGVECPFQFCFDWKNL